MQHITSNMDTLVLGFIFWLLYHPVSWVHYRLGCSIGTRAILALSQNAPLALKWLWVNMMTSFIKWKPFPRYWPFVRGIHRSPVNSPHKGQWRGPLVFSLICTWINGWVNNREDGDLRRHRPHYEYCNEMTFSKPQQNTKDANVSDYHFGQIN